MSEQSKWDKHYRDVPVSEATACQALQDFAHLLPAQGKALDLAAGRGGNALLLARHGLATSAWDISPVVLQQLATTARQQGLAIETSSRDLVLEAPQPDSFDVIVVSRFLHRPLCPQIAAALRPGGLLFYQTFVRDRVNPEFGPSNPDYLLARNELASLFAELTLVAYREEALIGSPEQGLRNEAYLVAQRPCF